jgi:phage shock protein C
LSALPPPAAGPRRLTRSRRHRLIAGVCGGIAEYIDVDVTVVRILYILVSILSAAFPGILAYIILMFVMPPSDASAP